MYPEFGKFGCSLVVLGHRVDFSRYKPVGYGRSDLGQNDKIMG
jgi:hypothetical protein